MCCYDFGSVLPQPPVCCCPACQSLMLLWVDKYGTGSDSARFQRPPREPNEPSYNRLINAADPNYACHRSLPLPVPYLSTHGMAVWMPPRSSSLNHPQWPCARCYGPCTRWDGPRARCYAPLHTLGWTLHTWDGLCTRWDGLCTRWDGLCTRWDGLCTRWDGLCTRWDGPCTRCNATGTRCDGPGTTCNDTATTCNATRTTCDAPRNHL